MTGDDLTVDEVAQLTVELLRAHLNGDDATRQTLVTNAPAEVVVAGLLDLFAAVIRNSTRDVDGFLDKLLLSALQRGRRRGLAAFIPSRMR